MIGARILVVEDEGIVAEDIRDILKNLGCSVSSVVSSGEEAVRRAAETRPDLVLMDIMLEGDMGGVEAAAQIYARFDIPVVYLTAYADDSTLQQAKMTGAFGYILKPFDERDLRSTIEMALHKHDTESELKEREQRSSGALRSIGDAVITTDTKGCVTLMNPCAQTLTGWKLEEARGKLLKNIFNITSEGAEKASENLVSRIIREGDLVGLADHSVLKAKGGKQLSIEGSGAPIKDDEGEITGVVLLFRSIVRHESDARDDVAGVEAISDRSAAGVVSEEITCRYSFDDIISNDIEIRRILGIIPDIARSDSAVLIEGPSGSGKELFARAIHDLSARRDRRYVVVSCGALPDTLLESELFGYVKGAFTGASKDKAGRFALAEGGTIFLDEIGDISPALQAKLLRALEQKQYEPLGAIETLTADVRVIAATNKNLSELVARGGFREDLFYRINVVKIVLPPLSSRREDIPLLVEHFIRRFNASKEKRIERISDNALELLMKHDFPGNVRELENIIEHAFVMCGGPEIKLRHLPEELVERVSSGEDAGTAPADSPLHQAERAAIVEALRKCNGNRRDTADYLDVSKTTLWRKMKKYGVTYDPTDEDTE